MNGRRGGDVTAPASPPIRSPGSAEWAVTEQDGEREGEDNGRDTTTWPATFHIHVGEQPQDCGNVFKTLKALYTRTHSCDVRDQCGSTLS